MYQFQVKNAITSFKDMMEKRFGDSPEVMALVDRKADELEKRIGYEFQAILASAESLHLPADAVQPNIFSKR